MTGFRYAALVASSLCWSLAPGETLRAQESDPGSPPGDNTLPTVLVADQRLDPYTQPAAVSTIDQDEVERFGQTGLDSVLRTTPGVYTWENPQQPGVAVNIRGFEGNGRVTSMIDGVRQNFRFTTHDASGFTYIDPMLIAGIDVQKGAVATVGGAGALAGSVNFRTIDIDDVLKPGAKFGVRLRGIAGSNNFGLKGMAATGARVAGKADIMAALVGGNSSSYKDGHGNRVADTGDRPTSGLVKLNVMPGEGQKISLSGMRYNNDFRANSYNQTVTNETYRLGYDYDAKNGIVDLSTHVYYNRLQMDYPWNDNTGSSRGREIRDKTWGMDLQNTSSLALGPINLSSTYGGEYAFDKVETKTGGVNPDGELSVGGLFAASTFSWKIFDFIAGLRYDFYKLKGSGEAGSSASAPGGGGAYDVDESNGKFDPKLTLAAHPLPWLQLYGNYEWTYRPPSTSEAFLGGTHGAGSSTSFYPNPNLDPERGRGWEIGSNVVLKDLLRQGDSLKLKADYYKTDVSNYITSLCSSDFRACYYDNISGRTQVHGIELQGSYDMGPVFGEISYAHNISHLPDTQDGLGVNKYQPEDVVSLTAGVRLLDRRLELGGRVTYTGDSPTTERGGDPGKDYTLYDLFASYDVYKGNRIFANVENLTNKVYQPAQFNDPSSSSYGRGRTILVGFDIQF